MTFLDSKPLFSKMTANNAETKRAQRLFVKG